MLPKLTVGVLSVSCTEARFVNWTVWFCESDVGGAAKAETADSDAAATTTPHANAMRMRDMQFLLGGVGQRRVGIEHAEEGEEGIVRFATVFMTRSGELRASGKYRKVGTDRHRMGDRKASGA